ncbi:roadblock/LC7 domain-containing protein [Lentzea nigeriaca]|uniref:roadblock/LC7 domain-containing protein n=1 Tax=Lentzea nigeriaca TaxID=1128665 RepID=UPI00195B003B|nr:roadblock/LC7 domain-containing protein [Lentzea nigeriaca]MBM7856923.1 putative regulator of Ras-like GTPase activity (Roadblock/LC7/MglB family) [Lentzea nigeriaca]
MNHDVLAAELHGLRERVTGITDTLIAANDGILIMADMSDRIDTEVISALAAADLGIARRTSEVAGQGAFRQTVVFSSNGCMAVYAVGALALMVVLGDEGLNVTRLHQESQPAIERINSVLTAA